MGLVEGVAGEGLYQVPDLLGQLHGKALALGALQEPLPLLAHQLGDFLTHGLAHDVRLAQGVSGEGLKDEQDLVLIDDDAIGLLQEVLEAGVGVLDGGPAMLGVYEGVDVLHRPGAVQGYHGRNVA